MRAPGISATGMSAQQMSIDNISNNIANSNTNAYNRGTVVFSDLLYQTLALAGSPTSGSGTALPSGMYMGNGVAVVGISKEFVSGAPMPKPGSDLSIYLEGNGFLQITLPDGSIGYTRDGALARDKDGLIVTHSGYQVLPGVTIPEGSANLTISPDGQITVELLGEKQTIGQFEIARFINPSGLKPIGNNIYTSTASSGDPVVGLPMSDTSFASIRQHFLEDSNVDTVMEMARLITAQRAFEFNSKVMQTADHLSQKIMEIKS